MVQGAIGVDNRLGSAIALLQSMHELPSAVIVAANPQFGPVADEQRIDTGIAIILDMAVIPLENPSGMQAFPVRRELGKGYFVQVAQIDPLTTALDPFAVASAARGHGRIVQTHQRAGQQLFMQQSVQYSEHLRRASHPVIERRSGQVNAVPSKPLCDAFDGQTIEEFAHDQMGEQARRSHTAGNRFGCGGSLSLLNPAAAAITSVFVATLFEDIDFGGLVDKALLLVVANLDFALAATRAAALDLGYPIVDDSAMQLATAAAAAAFAVVIVVVVALACRLVLFAIAMLGGIITAVFGRIAPAVLLAWRPREQLQ